MNETITLKEDGTAEIVKTETVETVEVVDIDALRAQVTEWERAIVEANAKIAKIEAAML